MQELRVVSNCIYTGTTPIIILVKEVIGVIESVIHYFVITLYMYYVLRIIKVKLMKLHFIACLLTSASFQLFFVPRSYLLHWYCAQNLERCVTIEKKLGHVGLIVESYCTGCPKTCYTFTCTCSKSCLDHFYSNVRLRTSILNIWSADEIF